MSAAPIVYIYATGSLEGSSSVQQKIMSQISAARKSGIPMEGWFFTVDAGEMPEAEGLRWFRVPAVNSGYFRSVRQAALIYRVIYETVKQQLPTDARVYMRYWAPGRSLCRLAGLLKGRLTFNHVTKEGSETAMYRPSPGSVASRLFGLAEFRWWPQLANHTWGRLIRRRAGRAVVNSEEIAKYQRGMAFGSYRCAIIADGVDAAAFPLHAAPPLQDEIRMVFLKGAAFEAGYNGLDRLMRGMAAGGSRRSMKLTVIGAGLEYEKGLAEAYGAGSFTEFKDRMSKTELDAELNRYHLGVGALALHRKGLTSTSTIKNREYFARGIPYFFAHHDPDIHGNPETLNYCLVAENNESPIGMAALEQFTERMYALPDRAAAMHALAVKHMDYQAKVKQIADFLQQS